MNPDGSGVAKLTSNTTPDHDNGPNWSPSGSKIAFSRGRAGADGYPDFIFTMNPDGSGVVRAHQFVRLSGRHWGR